MIVRFGPQQKVIISESDSFVARSALDRPLEHFFNTLDLVSIGFWKF